MNSSVWISLSWVFSADRCSGTTGVPVSWGLWSNKRKKDWLRTSPQIDKKGPTPEFQIPEWSCILLQVPSVPFQTLAFSTQELKNLRPNKLMGTIKALRPGVVPTTSTHASPSPPTNVGSRRRSDYFFCSETWDRNNWCSLSGPWMSPQQ